MRESNEPLPGREPPRLAWLPVGAGMTAYGATPGTMPGAAGGDVPLAGRCSIAPGKAQGVFYDPAYPCVKRRAARRLGKNLDLYGKESVLRIRSRPIG